MKKRVVSIKLGIPLEDAIAQIVKANMERYGNMSEVSQRLGIARGTVYKYTGNPKFQGGHVNEQS